MREIKRPVRVCYLIDELATAGTEMQLLSLIRNLDRKIVVPSLALLGGESDESRQLEPKDCPVLRLGLKSFKSLRVAICVTKFMHFLWRERIDVLQVYFPDSSYFGIVSGFLAGVRHRLRTRNNSGHWMTQTHRVLGRCLNLLSTKTITNCQIAKRQLLIDERPNPAKVEVLENGVDLQGFSYSTEFTRADPDKQMIGVVANLREVKGLDILVEAIGILRNEFPKLTCTIAGEGELRQQLTNQILKLGLQERIRLIGKCHNIPQFLSEIQIAVSPSRSEGMSNAILEYMAAGKAIVATAVGATPELITNQVHGILIPPENSCALAKGIARFLQNPKWIPQFGAAARERVEKQYSRRAMIRRFEDFYLKLVSS